MNLPNVHCYTVEYIWSDKKIYITNFLKLFPLTCKNLQICLGNDWASQRTENLSFPSVNPESGETHRGTLSDNCSGISVLVRGVTGKNGTPVVRYLMDGKLSNMKLVRLTSLLPVMTAACDPGGSIRRGAPTDKFCPCCNWMDCGRMRCC